MERSAPRRLAAAVAILLGMTMAPSTAAVSPACASQHRTLRIWSGEALSQTFSPTADTVSRIDLKIFFRRAFSGAITARLQLNVPSDVAGQAAVRGIEVRRLRSTASGAAGTSAWVTFRPEEPVSIPSTLEAPVMEIELRPGTDDPAWAWAQCASNYTGGRAYGRAAVRMAGVTVPNEAAKLTLSGSADLQFRVYG